MYSTIERVRSVQSRRPGKHPTQSAAPRMWRWSTRDQPPKTRHGKDWKPCLPMMTSSRESRVPKVVPCALAKKYMYCTEYSSVHNAPNFVAVTKRRLAPVCMDIHPYIHACMHRKFRPKAINQSTWLSNYQQTLSDSDRLRVSTQNTLPRWPSITVCTVQAH